MEKSKDILTSTVPVMEDAISTFDALERHTKDNQARLKTVQELVSALLDDNTQSATERASKRLAVATCIKDMEADFEGQIKACEERRGDMAATKNIFSIVIRGVETGASTASGGNQDENGRS